MKKNNCDEQSKKAQLTAEVENDKLYIVLKGELIELSSFIIAAKKAPNEDNKRDTLFVYEGELPELLELKSLTNIMITEHHKNQIFNN